MKIECILHRPGGTRVTIGSAMYHFRPLAPDQFAPHVADVENEAHAKRFLKLREAYREFQDTTAPAAPDPVADPDPDPAQAPAPASEDAVETQVNPDAEKAAQAAATAEDDLEAMDIEQLREIFANEIGRKPGPRSGADTLIAQIKARRAGE